MNGFNSRAHVNSTKHYHVPFFKVYGFVFALQNFANFENFSKSFRFTQLKVYSDNFCI